MVSLAYVISKRPCANPNLLNGFSSLYCFGGIGGFGNKFITLVPHNKAAVELKVLWSNKSKYSYLFNSFLK